MPIPQPFKTQLTRELACSSEEVAWCRLRQEGRFFRLDRIRRAELTAELTPPRDYAETLGYIPDPGVRPEWDYAVE